MKHRSLGLLACGLFAWLACQHSEKTDETTKGASAATERVLLEGSFRAVAKSAKGRARVVQEGENYELRLDGVELAADGAHVYLVGLDDARTSAAVDGTETKYDMGPLEPPDQVIQLPSEPAASLRVVVLWQPRFGVNLAAAPLREP